MMTDIFERIATEAGQVLRRTNAATLSARVIQTAVCLVLPGELSKFAVSEGRKALPGCYSMREINSCCGFNLNKPRKIPASGTQISNPTRKSNIVVVEQRLTV
jgi:hypothetical protein